MRLRALAVLAVGAALSISANATILFGQTVRVTHDAPSIGTPISGPFDAVVGPGLEVPSILGFYSADLSDTNIFLDFTQFPSASAAFSGAAFNGFHLFDLNSTIPTFLSATINSTNVAGLDASRVTFDANNIYINFQGLTVTPSSRVSVDITAVPEPRTLGSIGLVLAALALLRRWSPR